MHLTLLITFLLPSVIISHERIWIGDLVLKHVPPTTTKSSTTIGDFVLNSNPTTPAMTPLATTPITVTTNKPKSMLHLCSICKCSLTFSTFSRPYYQVEVNNSP